MNIIILKCLLFIMLVHQRVGSHGAFTCASERKSFHSFFPAPCTAPALFLNIHQLQKHDFPAFVGLLLETESHPNGMSPPLHLTQMETPEQPTQYPQTLVRKTNSKFHYLCYFMGLKTISLRSNYEVG